MGRLLLYRPRLGFAMGQRRVLRPALRPQRRTARARLRAGRFVAESLDLDLAYTRPWDCTRARPARRVDAGVARPRRVLDGAHAPARRGGAGRAGRTTPSSANAVCWSMPPLG